MHMAILLSPVNLQKVEFDATTAEGQCRVTIVTGTVQVMPSGLRVDAPGVNDVQQRASYKVLVDPTLAPGKFRKATATVSALGWAGTTNSLPGSSSFQIEDAEATLDDEAGRVQLIIDALVEASGTNNISQLFGFNFQVTTLAVVSERRSRGPDSLCAGEPLECWS
jgi:hypothetical protein